MALEKDMVRKIRQKGEKINATFAVAYSVGHGIRSLGNIRWQEAKRITRARDDKVQGRTWNGSLILAADMEVALRKFFVPTAERTKQAVAVRKSSHRRVRRNK